MKGKDILQGLEYIGDDLIENAEFGQFPSEEQETRKPRRPIRRPLLVAALIALLFLLAGCSVVYAVYVLRMGSVKIGTGTAQRDYSLVDGVYVEDPHTVDTTTLTLAGLEGSNAYKACADFYAFKTEYTAQGEEMGKAGTLPENFWDDYGNVMYEKGLELAEKYSLKPEGQSLSFRTTRNLCNALGVERFIRDNQGIGADIDAGGCYDTGNFWLNMSFRFPENSGYDVTYSLGALHWNRYDCFSPDYVTLEDNGDWVERSYTTASGNTVLILRSPNQERGYILCDRGDAMMSLRLDVNPEFYSDAGGVVSVEREYMTDEQLNLVADTIDFAISPRIPTQADVDAQAQPPQEATQDGYTLRLKSVETDGYVTRVLISVTAPEGVDIENLKIGTDRTSFTTAGRQSRHGGGGLSAVVADGDGLANTIDILAEYYESFQDGLRPFELGATWDLGIIDLYADKRSASSQILAEGEWHFSITFDETNTDYRELELLSSPITMTGSVGWLADGTDVLMDFPIASFKLRKFSSEITRDTAAETEEQRAEAEMCDPEFYAWRGHLTYAVMKDGTQIQLLPDRNCDHIDLAQVDYVLLADGRKLPVS